MTACWLHFSETGPEKDLSPPGQTKRRCPTRSAGVPRLPGGDWPEPRLPPLCAVFRSCLQNLGRLQVQPWCQPFNCRTGPGDGHRSPPAARLAAVHPGPERHPVTAQEMRGVRGHADPRSCSPEPPGPSMHPGSPDTGGVASPLTGRVSSGAGVPKVGENGRSRSEGTTCRKVG